MSIPNKQIGWSQESNLLWYILKQLNKLTAIIFNLKPKYKVYTALLTQSGVDNQQSLSSGAVTKGVTYYIDGASNISDFSNVGGPPLGTNDEYFVATNSDVPNEYDGATLIYNTGAPVVTVLENTIGNIWFTYNNVGFYTIKSNSLFTTNKTTFFMGIMDNNPGQPIIGTDHFANDESTYQFIITDQSGGFQNEFLYNTPIEIRVYN